MNTPSKKCTCLHTFELRGDRECKRHPTSSMFPIAYEQLEADIRHNERGKIAEKIEKMRIQELCENTNTDLYEREVGYNKALEDVKNVLK